MSQVPPDNPARAARQARIEAEAETLRRHYEDTGGNPLFAWTAIRLFMRWGAGGQTESYPLPEWLSQFLGNIAERVTELAEGVDADTMPGPPKSDDRDADLHAWVNRVGAWEEGRSLDVSEARDRMLKILGFCGTGKRVFCTFERRVQLQRQAERFAHELHHTERTAGPAMESARSKLIRDWVERKLAADASNLRRFC